MLSPDGRQDHVARQINADEAAVIRRIYELCAAWLGLTRIAKKPNAERVQPPRNHRTGWAPTAILEILRRPLYRGEIVWGKGQKAMRGGAKALEHPYCRAVQQAAWVAPAGDRPNPVAVSGPRYDQWIGG